MEDEEKTDDDKQGSLPGVCRKSLRNSVKFSSRERDGNTRSRDGIRSLAKRRARISRSRHVLMRGWRYKFDLDLNLSRASISDVRSACVRFSLFPRRSLRAGVCILSAVSPFLFRPLALASSPVIPGFQLPKTPSPTAE